MCDMSDGLKGSGVVACGVLDGSTPFSCRVAMLRWRMFSSAWATKVGRKFWREKKTLVGWPFFFHV